MWNLEKFKNNLAIITENGDEISYLKLFEYCKDFSKTINKRCLIFNLCKNEIGSLIGYVACINSKIVPLMLKYDLDYNLLKELIQIYKPDYINLPSDLSNKFSEYRIVYEKFNYSLLKTSFNNVYLLNENLALLLTTSGSTGSPKLVRQTYKNIESNTKSIVKYLSITDKDRTITTLPMNYTYGISIINSHLWVGASIILTEKTLFWQQLMDYHATSFGGVPYTYEMLYRLGFTKNDYPDLRYVTQAGGKLSPFLHELFAKWAIEKQKKFIVMYGQTEATARMGYLPAEKSLEKFGSIGIAIPGGKFILIDSNGKEITKAEEVGELVYRGDNVTLGYAKCGDDLIKGDENYGRLATGDMAKFDSDGYYYIVGRKKRFLKIFGNRVNLDEIEQLLKNQFINSDFACSGIDEKMNVFITNESLKDEVSNFLVKRLKFHSVSFIVSYISEIPRNEAGKILYKDLPVI